MFRLDRAPQPPLATREEGGPDSSWGFISHNATIKKVLGLAKRRSSVIKSFQKPSYPFDFEGALVPEYRQ
jgi:hypothetical protein